MVQHLSAHVCGPDSTSEVLKVKGDPTSFMNDSSVMQIVAHGLTGDETKQEKTVHLQHYTVVTKTGHPEKTLISLHYIFHSKKMNSGLTQSDTNFLHIMGIISS